MGFKLKLSSSSFFRQSMPNILLFVVAVYLLSAVLIPPLADAMAIVLLLIGLVGLRAGVQYLRVSPLLGVEKFLLFIFFGYSLVSIASFLYWPYTKDSHMRLEDDLKFMLFIPLYLVLRLYCFNWNVLLYVFAIFAILLGVSSVLIYLEGCCSPPYLPNIHPYFDIFSWNRPSGSVNPMRYAAVALIVMAFLVNAKLVIRGKGVPLNAALMLAIVLALVACILTNTRGVWLAIPVLLVAYLYFLYKQGQFKYVWLVLAVAGLLSVAILQSSFVQKRINTTLHNFELYGQGYVDTSLGARLDMYKFSLTLISQNPLWGHGLGGFKAKAQEARKRGEIEGAARELGVRRTPHNEFLQVLIERGVLGLFVVLGLFFIPAVIFYRALKSKDEGVLFYGLNGMVVLLVFFVAGQTGTLFNHNVFTHFYIILILLFASQITVLDCRAEQGRVIKSNY